MFGVASGLRRAKRKSPDFLIINIYLHLPARGRFLLRRSLETTPNPEYAFLTCINSGKISKLYLQPSLPKRNQKIHTEIPRRHHHNSNQLCQIEIHFQLAVQQQDNEVIDGQSDHGDEDKREVFAGDLFTLTGESPQAVPDVIRRGSQYKTG